MITLSNDTLTTVVNFAIIVLAFAILIGLGIKILYPMFNKGKHLPMFRANNGGMTISFYAMIFSLFGSIMLAIVTSNIQVGETEVTRTKTADLVALNTDRAVQGSFFLGSGSVGNQRSFVMNLRTEREDGRSALNQITTSISQTTVFESDDVSPEYVEVREHKTVLSDRIFGRLPLAIPDTILVEVTIPTGSVLDTYNMDTK